MKKLFYTLTSWWPRKLPQTTKELDSMLSVLKTYFSLEDSPQVWLTVLGQICSTNQNKMRKSYLEIVTVAKRLNVNKIANDKKAGFYVKLEEQLAEKLKAEAEKQPETVESADAYIS